MKNNKAKVLSAILMGLIFLFSACTKNDEVKKNNEITKESEIKLYKNSYSDNTTKDEFCNLQYIVPTEWNIVNKSEEMYSYRDDINGVELSLMYIGETENATELLEEVWFRIKEESLKERYEWCEEKYSTPLHDIHGIFGKGKVKLEQWEEAENVYTFIFISENEIYMVFMHVSNSTLYDYVDDFYKFLTTIKAEEEQEIEETTYVAEEKPIETTVLPTNEIPKPTQEETTEIPTKLKTEEISNGITIGQKNALDKAASYLKHSNFSYQGLVEQLEYEKFSEEEAIYAVDNCGANWNEQALGQAKSYLSHSAFSYIGLIEQLEYEDFTSEQARYAVDNCGADWNEQAAKCAKSYLSHSSFSKDGLIEQLEYEGFTHEQAVFGVQQNGY